MTERGVPPVEDDRPSGHGGCSQRCCVSASRAEVECAVLVNGCGGRWGPAVHDMVRAGLDRRPLTATAALVWNGDLPRPLQQILFQTADGITPQLAAMGLLAAAAGRASGIR